MVNPRRFIALTFALLATLLGVGYVQGVWSDRWVSDAAIEDVKEMERVPMRIGAWEGKAIQVDATLQALPDANSFLRRRYVSQVDGTVATILLTRGRPGPMVIKHLPTECYPSSGFDAVVEPKRFLTQNKVPDEFWVATFKKTNDVLPLTIRIYWSWSGNGQWQTPDRPRLTFAPYPVLYKLYVIQTIPNENEAFEGAPVHDFIKELTNKMRESLFTAVPK